jgi:hypothetical protein
MPHHGSSVRGTSTATRATATRAGLRSAADGPAVVVKPMQAPFAPLPGVVLVSGTRNNAIDRLVGEFRGPEAFSDQVLPWRR